MESRFVQAFSGWFTIITNILLIVGIFSFSKLPKEKRVNIHYWLPFLILAFTVFYENMGAYTNYNFEFKKSVNAYLGNTKYPQFNLWLFNITKRQFSVILYLMLIKTWLHPSKHKYVNLMSIGFIVLVISIQIAGIEPLYLNQPIIFAIGANMILVGCGMYFLELISLDRYLLSQPLRLMSFWQGTFLMFTFTLGYISSVALMYLYEVNPVMGAALQQIENIMQVCTLAVLVFTIISPSFHGALVEKEPSHEFS